MTDEENEQLNKELAGLSKQPAIPILASCRTSNGAKRVAAALRREFPDRIVNSVGHVLVCDTYDTWTFLRQTAVWSAIRSGGEVWKGWCAVKPAQE